MHLLALGAFSRRVFASAASSVTRGFNAPFGAPCFLTVLNPGNTSPAPNPGVLMHYLTLGAVLQSETGGWPRRTVDVLMHRLALGAF